MFADHRFGNDRRCMPRRLVATVTISVVLDGGDSLRPPGGQQQRFARRRVRRARRGPDAVAAGHDDVRPDRDGDARTPGHGPDHADGDIQLNFTDTTISNFAGKTITVTIHPANPDHDGYDDQASGRSPCRTCRRCRPRTASYIRSPATERPERPIACGIIPAEHTRPRPPRLRYLSLAHLLARLTWCLGDMHSSTAVADRRSPIRGART